jgi:hypothetical protein
MALPQARQRWMTNEINFFLVRALALVEEEDKSIKIIWTVESSLLEFGSYSFCSNPFFIEAPYQPIPIQQFLTRNQTEKICRWAGGWGPSDPNVAPPVAVNASHAQMILSMRCSRQW